VWQAKTEQPLKSRVVYDGAVVAELIQDSHTHQLRVNGAIKLIIVDRANSRFRGTPRTSN
jgi:hypothetical protein